MEIVNKLKNSVWVIFIDKYCDFFCDDLANSMIRTTVEKDTKMQDKLENSRTYLLSKYNYYIFVTHIFETY